MTSSQSFIPIQDIKDDLIFLKDGGVSLVITTSAVNFALLFETEQLSIIDAFAGLLNSLSFPIQIVIRSKRMDVSSYLHTLDEASKRQSSPLLKSMISYYRQFVSSIIKENNVLDKQFYVCLNVSAIELGVLPKSIADKTKKALTILLPRHDHLIRQLTRLGLKARQLKTEELIQLFYDIYNPSDAELSFEPDAFGNFKTDAVPLVPAIPVQPPAQPPPPVVAPAPPPPVALSRAPFPPGKPLAPPNPPPINQTPPPSIANLSPPFIVEELTDDFGP